MKKRNLFTKAVSGALAALMAFGALTSLRGAALPVVKAEETEPKYAELDKTAVLQADGSYTIDLEAHTKGKVTVHTTTVTKPVDYVLLLDQSSSMGDTEHIPTAPRDYLAWQGHTHEGLNGIGPLTITGNHITSLKQAAREFIDHVHSHSSSDQADHRIAMLGFAGDEWGSSRYSNTEVFVGANQYNYGVDAEDHYGEAFRNVTVPAELAQLHASVDALDAEGVTALHLGMDMVKGVLEADRAQQPQDSDREKVVIVFTDGMSGTLGFNREWANRAVDTANYIKNTLGAKIFVISLISYDRNFEYRKRYDRLIGDIEWLNNPSVPDYQLMYNYLTQSYYPYRYDCWANVDESSRTSVHNDVYRLVECISSNYPQAVSGSLNEYGYLDYMGQKAADLPTIEYDFDAMSQPLIKDGYCVDLRDMLDISGYDPIQNIAGLMEAFVSVGQFIEHEISITEAGVEIDGSAFMTDKLSQYFKMPEGFGIQNITVRTQKCTGGSFDAGFTFGDIEEYVAAAQPVDGWYALTPANAANPCTDMKVSFDPYMKTVNLTGFNYKEQFCGTGPNGEAKGRKLLMTITGIEAESHAVGMELPTNVEAKSGITMELHGNPEDHLRFPLPKVDIREKYVVYDFSTLLEEEHSHEFFDKTPRSHDVVRVHTLDDCYKTQTVTGGEYDYHATFPYEGCEDYAERARIFTVSIAGDNFDHANFQPLAISWRDYHVGALLECDPARNDGVTYEWCRLTFLPATNVHYEEPCLDYVNSDGSAWSSGNQHSGTGNWILGGSGSPAGNQSSANGGPHSEYGYSTGYAQGGHKDSNGASMMVKVDNTLLSEVTNNTKSWPVGKFHFTGTGFDLISHSAQQTGVLMVDIVPHGLEQSYADAAGNHSRHLIVDTYYESSAFLFQIPVLRVVGLDYLEQGYDVYVSAVYHPLFDRASASGVITSNELPGIPEGVEYEFTAVDPDHTRTPERAVGYFEVYVDSVRVYNPRGLNLTEENGIDYTAYYEANELNPEYTQIRSLLLADPNSDTSALYIDGQNGNVTIAQYMQSGPNNETYLWAAPKGQHADRAIAFTVANWDPDETGGTRVHISAKAPTGVVRLYANGIFVADVESATELYFDITDIMRATTTDGHVTISAEQAENVDVAHPVLSLVNLKVMKQTVVPTELEKHTVTWVDGLTGQVYKSIEVHHGDYLDENDFPIPNVHEGYEFDNWDYSHAPVTDDLTITARYVADTVLYTVTFIDQVTGSVLDTMQVAHGSVLDTSLFPAPPVHDGYRYIGHDYEPNTEIHRDTVIIYEYDKIGKVIVNFYMNAGSLSLQGAQVLLDKDHDTFDTTIPIPAQASATVTPTASWYSAMEYLIPGGAGSTVPNGSSRLGVEIEPGTYDLFVLTSANGGAMWYFRGQQSRMNDVTLTDGSVVDIRYNGNDVVVTITPGSSGNASASESTKGGASGSPSALKSDAPASSELSHPIYADIETFNFAEAILCGVEGDANHDRRADVLDALTVMRHCLGSDSGIDAYGRYCGDLNRDLLVDLLDAVAILRLVLNAD